MITFLCFTFISRCLTKTPLISINYKTAPKHLFEIPPHAAHASWWTFLALPLDLIADADASFKNHEKNSSERRWRALSLAQCKAANHSVSVELQAVPADVDEVGAAELEEIGAEAELAEIVRWLTWAVAPDPQALCWERATSWPWQPLSASGTWGCRSLMELGLVNWCLREVFPGEPRWVLVQLLLSSHVGNWGDVLELRELCLSLFLLLSNLGLLRLEALPSELGSISDAFCSATLWASNPKWLCSGTKCLKTAAEVDPQCRAEEQNCV